MPANRVEVMHGVNLDMLGRRDPEQYGNLTLPELEVAIGRFARDLGLTTTFFHSNHEGEFVEHLHRLPDVADAAIINAGAWTHYSWAIHDALEFSGVPAVEVHISDISAREDWRKVSVFDDLVIGKVFGRRLEGYREALEMIARELGAAGA